MNYIDQLLNGRKVEWKTLGEVAELKRGRVISKTYLTENTGDYSVYSSQTMNNGEIGKIDTFDFEGDYLTWTTDGAYAGTIFKRKGKFSITNVCGLIDANKEILNLDFLFHWLSITTKKYVYSGMGNPKLMSNQIAKIPIPLPPIDVQREIAEILDKISTLEATLEAEKTLREKQYTYYRDKLLSFGDNVQWKTLGEVAKIKNGKDWKKLNSGDIPVYGSGGVMGYVDAFAYNKPSVLIPRKGSITNLFYLEKPFWNVDTIYYTEIDTSQIVPKFFYYFMKTIDLMALDTGSGRPSLTQAILNEIKIPLPPLAEQQRIAGILDQFDKLVNDISEGIPAEIIARRKQYEYYREQLLNFKED